MIPVELKDNIESNKLFSMRFDKREDIDVTLDICRKAIDQKRFLQLDYQRADDVLSQRRIRPLGLYFWGQVWSLVGWCELREDFRNFRLDRMRDIMPENNQFIDTEGQALSDFVSKMKCDNE